MPRTPRKTSPKAKTRTRKTSPVLTEKTVKRVATKAARAKGTPAEALVAAGFAAYDVVKKNLAGSTKPRPRKK